MALKRAASQLCEITSRIVNPLTLAYAPSCSRATAPQRDPLGGTVIRGPS